jgi:hypothetical protein
MKKPAKDLSLDCAVSIDREFDDQPEMMNQMISMMMLWCSFLIWGFVRVVFSNRILVVVPPPLP